MGMVVKYNGETHELPESGLSDAVAFERQFGTPSSILGSVDDPSGAVYTAEPGKNHTDDETLVGTPVQVPHPDQRLEHLMFMVFRGLVRLGVVARGRQMDDEFLDAVEEIDVTPEAGDTDADPTGVQAARPGRSRS